MSDLETRVRDLEIWKDRHRERNEALEKRAEAMEKRLEPVKTFTVDVSTKMVERIAELEGALREAHQSLLTLTKSGFDGSEINSLLEVRQYSASRALVAHRVLEGRGENEKAKISKND